MRLYGFFTVAIDGKRCSIAGSAPLNALADIDEELENILLELGIVWAEVEGWHLSIHNEGAKPH